MAPQHVLRSDEPYTRACPLPRYLPLLLHAEPSTPYRPLRYRGLVEESQQSRHSFCPSASLYGLSHSFSCLHVGPSTTRLLSSACVFPRSSTTARMRNYFSLFLALCSLLCLTAAQSALPTSSTVVVTPTLSGVSVTASASATGPGGSANATTTGLGGGTGSTASSSSTTSSPPDVLLRVPNLSVGRIEYVFLRTSRERLGATLLCLILGLTKSFSQAGCRQPSGGAQSRGRGCFTRDNQRRRASWHTKGQHHYR